MTSLKNQLKKLKKAPTQSLAVERDYSSLLFTKKEAAGYDRDDFYKIGLNGLAGMKNLDDDFDMYEPELFEKKKLHFNRAMLLKEEAEELNRQIEAMILRLSPYFHHQCCRQVLEWLIYKYQVHTYNAETLFLAFLPYHGVNSFGRLIHILKFNSPDMDWLAEYQKDASTIPLNILCRACQSSDYWLITTISSFIERAIDIFDADFVDTKIHHYFTFLVSLYGTLVENQAGRVDEQLLSRLVPFLGSALKSKVDSFKCAGMMLICTLVMNTSLNEELAQNVMKLLLRKIKPGMCKLVLETAIVVCDRLELRELPKKSILRLVQKSEELQLAGLISSLMEKYDVTPFLVPFWKIIMDELKFGEDANWRDHYATVLIECLNLEQMTAQQAQLALGLLLDWVDSAIEAESANEGTTGKEMRIFPKKLRKHIRPMAIQFPTAFDGIRAKRKAEGIERMMRECHIEDHEVIELEMMAKPETNERKRKRGTSGVTEEEEESQRILSKIKLEDITVDRSYLAKLL